MGLGCARTTENVGAAGVPPADKQIPSGVSSHEGHDSVVRTGFEQQAAAYAGDRPGASARRAFLSRSLRLANRFHLQARRENRDLRRRGLPAWDLATTQR